MCVVSTDIYRFNYIHWITRSMLGIIASMLLLIIMKRSIILLLILTVSLAAILSTSNNMSNRIDDLYQLQSLEIDKIKYRSIRERIYYNLSGTELLQDNYLYGIGPQNLMPNIESLIIRDNITTVRLKIICTTIFLILV